MPARATSIRFGGLLASAPSLLPFVIAIDRVTPQRGARRAREAPAQRSARACPTRVVKRAQRGSKRAFAKLWRRYAPTVHGVLLTMVREADADDLAQEVAIAALRALPSLARPESFPAWLCTIARNMGRDALKAKHAGKHAPIDAAHDVPAPPRGDEAEAEEILATIRSLPTCHREPLLLRLMFGMSGPEIAAQTGMTEGSVRVTLCRGMKLLRRRLKDWE